VRFCLYARTVFSVVLPLLSIAFFIYFYTQMNEKTRILFLVADDWDENRPLVEIKPLDRVDLGTQNVHIFGSLIKPCQTLGDGFDKIGVGKWYGMEQGCNCTVLNTTEDYYKGSCTYS
jgi:hypothetical protein